MKTDITKKRFWRSILVALSITTIFASCQDTFDELLGICPEVESTNPEDKAIGVPLNKVISVTFNEEMNPASIIAAAFSLRVINPAGGVDSSVSGTLTYDVPTNTMNFLPDSPLIANTTYTGTVEPIVKDLLGNALQTAYMWTFTTGVAPTVTSTNPTNLATGIALNTAITATFSAEMDPATINATSFILKADTTKIAGVVSYQNGTATFIPSVDLLPATTYTGTISVIAKNSGGIPLANAYTWTFNTGAAPTIVSTAPADKAINVSINTDISVVFSQEMDPNTLSGSTFMVKQGTTAIAGTVTYSGTTATFIPNTPLSSSLVYTATVSTGAKNKLGIALMSNYVWNFTTAASEVVVAPTVVSTDPTNNASNVAFDKTVKAVFSQEMNPATITASTFSLKQGNTVVSGTLSFSGTTLSFKPNSPLSPGLVYTGTITTGVKNTLGTALATNFVWSFTTAASEVAVAPTVTSTDPVNNATNVAFDKVVKAIFSQAMDPSTINASTFSLKQGNTTVTGTLSFNGSTLTFTPSSPLSPGLVYIGTITTGAKNILGTPLGSNYIWKFTTAAAEALIVPTVISTDPDNGATNVAITKTIKAVFSEEMDPSSISNATFTLKQGNNVIAGTVSYAGTTASFVPNNPLSSSLVYTATITTGAKNSAGTAMASNYVWTFTTAAAVVPPTVTSTDPADKATNVSYNKTIKAAFSEAMDPTTISGATFQLKQGDTVIPGTVSYSGGTASFLPNNPLSANLVYTATITTGVKNLSGLAMENNYVWTFTTSAVPVPPTVTSTDPVDKATNVPLNKTIKAFFNEAMDPATISGTTFTVKQGNTSVAGTVTYVGTTATFVPTNPLTPSLVYTVTITTGAKNVSGTALASDYIWTFTTVPPVPPTVTSTDPENNATNVALNKTIKAVFSEEMDPASVTGATFLVKQGESVVAGTVSYTGTTASFVPTNPLLAGLVYTATITTGAKSSAGTAMANNYVWSFSTVAPVPPTVTSTDPENNATNVALNKTIRAVFSEAMDPATISGTTFLVKQGDTVVAGTVSYTGTTASFVPTNPLLAGQVYTATITTGAKSSTGTAMASNYVWSFTTVAAIPPTVTSTDPQNNATNVALNKTIRAVFSEPMDQATITGTTFLVKQGNTVVTGTVSYSGTTASFVPTNPLLAGQVYTATITTGAKNLSGTALANNYVWSFTTAVAIAPTVLSTDPQNNAQNVELNKVIRATFSEPMNPATISGSTFTLRQGANTINGSVTYTGTTASFTPNSPLSSNQTYTATITTGAQNLAGTGLAEDYVWTFTTLTQQSAYFVDLKTAGRFGIFAATGISNNAGFSVIRNLDVGITPGARSSVTGFPPATIVNGAIYAADDASPAGVAAMLIQAKQHLLEAYLFAEGATSPAPSTIAGDQGGKTLAPGIYKSNTSLLIQAGDLTLDAQGDENAVWIFQIGSSFTTVGGAGGSIILSGGAKAENIFWQVGSSATIGDNTAFKGNVLALTSITMNSNAKIVGRMLVLNGAVVMTNTNTIEKP